jgi:hypothetical protein
MANVAVYVPTPHEHTQAVAASTWLLEHGFGRDIQVEFYSDDDQHRLRPASITPVSPAKLAHQVTFQEAGVPKALTGRALVW